MIICVGLVGLLGTLHSTGSSSSTLRMHMSYQLYTPVHGALVGFLYTNEVLVYLMMQHLSHQPASNATNAIDSSTGLVSTSISQALRSDRVFVLHYYQ